MARLDDFVKSKGVARVDYIKADIEGGELNLLRGGENVLETFHPNILIEIVDIHCRRFGHAPQDVCQYLLERATPADIFNEQGELLDLDPKHLPNGNFLFEQSR